MTWTLFWDMHSGGRTKVDPYDKIYIEAPLKEAMAVFYSKFGRDPLHITCSCCGEDYSVDEYQSLERASAYLRNCQWITPIKPEHIMKLGVCDPKAFEWNKDNPGRYLEAGEQMPDGWHDGGFKPYKPAITIEEYLKEKNVKIVYANEITDKERSARVPNYRDDYGRIL